MLEKPEIITIAAKISINSKNVTMRGLCHSCYSTGVETIFDELMSPICSKCQEKD